MSTVIQTRAMPAAWACSGRGKIPCKRMADVFVVPPRGHCVGDALYMLDHWLAWYDALPWWRRIFL